MGDQNAEVARLHLLCPVIFKYSRAFRFFFFQMYCFLKKTVTSPQNVVYCDCRCSDVPINTVKKKKKISLVLFPWSASLTLELSAFHPSTITFELPQSVWISAATDRRAPAALARKSGLNNGRHLRMILLSETLFIILWPHLGLIMLAVAFLIVLCQ